MNTGDFLCREGKVAGPGPDFLGHQDVRSSLPWNLACCDNLPVAQENGCATRFSTAFPGRSQIDTYVQANVGAGAHHDLPEPVSAEFCHRPDMSPAVIGQPASVACAGRWESQVVDCQLWLSELIRPMEVAKPQDLGLPSMLATFTIPNSDGNILLQAEHRLPHPAGDMVNCLRPLQIQGFSHFCWQAEECLYGGPPIAPLGAQSISPAIPAPKHLGDQEGISLFRPLMPPHLTPKVVMRKPWNCGPPWRDQEW